MRVLFVTTKQPSTNPRLRKSADCLAAHGHEVHVLYGHTAQWADEADKAIFTAAQWTSECIGGHPKGERIAYFCHRVVRKGNALLGNSARAWCRGYADFVRKGIAWRPDIVIGHNPGSLAPVSDISSHRQIPMVFDAEDFHRGELHAGNPARLEVIELEDAVIPRLTAMTAASPLIAFAYGQLYPSVPLTFVANSFPRHYAAQKLQSYSGPLRLVWFGQVAGPDRGIIEFVRCINHCPDFSIVLTVIGTCQPAMRSSLQSLLTSNAHRIDFLNPMPEKEMFSVLSKNEIGLALELGLTENNCIAQSNKLHGYPLGGCLTLSTPTPGQLDFLSDHPETGMTISLADPVKTVDLLRGFFHNRNELLLRRHAAWEYARERLTWESESQQLLSSIDRALGLT